MSNSIFDLEQEMLQFANVTDDIDRVTKYCIFLQVLVCCAHI